MKNIYFKATDLYLVKPTVITYSADNYIKLEQRISDIDIAIKSDNRYFSIFDTKEYVKFNKPDMNNYYIDVNKEDKMLLLRYLYENEEWTDEMEEEISSLIKYFDYYELQKNLNNIKKDEDINIIQKIKK